MGREGKGCLRRWPAGGRRRLLNPAPRNSTDQRTVFAEALFPDLSELLSSARQKWACCLNHQLIAPVSHFASSAGTLPTHTCISTTHICMQEPSVYFAAGTSWLGPSLNTFLVILNLNRPFNCSHLKVLSHKTFCSGIIDPRAEICTMPGS